MMVIITLWHGVPVEKTGKLKPENNNKSNYSLLQSSLNIDDLVDPRIQQFHG